MYNFYLTVTVFQIYSLPVVGELLLGEKTLVVLEELVMEVVTVVGSEEML